MHKFSPHNFERLENAGRYALLQPEQTLRRFGLREGMTFLDIGAGTGFFSREASKIIGEEGVVYAVDISSEMLQIFQQFGVPANVRLLRSDESTLPLRSSLADLTLFAFVLHESLNIHESLAEAARVTKRDGRIAVIEWKKQKEEHGPPMEERMSMDELRPRLSGHRIIDEGDLNPSHYYCIIQVPEKK